MTFEKAERYKLTNSKGYEAIYSRDQVAYFISSWNLGYRYISRSPTVGTLEVFNDEIDEIFNVVLYYK